MKTVIYSKPDFPYDITILQKAALVFFLIITFQITTQGQEKEISSIKSNKGKLGVVYDRRYLDHIFRKGSYESPQRLYAIIQSLKNSDITDCITWLTPNKNAEQVLPLVHNQKHIDKILSDERTGNAALLAVSGALCGIDAVMTSKVSSVFCAIRPPGHHARNMGREEGFCYFNNVALAVRYAQNTYRITRVLIVDWDYHHGNGTEEIFYEDSTVLFFSTHNANDFPRSGFPRRKGKGAGEGLSINVHLRCRTQDHDIITAFRQKLLPAARIPFPASG
jgi:acetoin utilization deacetylase AcuC-like enzyme